MRIETETLRSLDLIAAGQAVTTKPIDRTPLLIIDRCLTGSEVALKSFATAAYSSGTHVASETLTMPRSGFGPRPVNMIAAPGRAVYGALCERLRTSLPEETRSSENWSNFTSVALDDPGDSYLVEFDIASCYEYVDHELLHRELLLQSMDVEASNAVVGFLGEVFGRPRGLPQLLSPSDLLSDAYLQGIERALLRSGYNVQRYADDFKITATDWGRANDIIEHAADIARGYGLVLSSGKTNIRKVSTVRATRQKRVDFLAEYFSAARDDLTQIDVFHMGYGDFEEVESRPTDQQALEAAFWRILQEWHESNEDTEGSIPFHSQHIPLALKMLREAGTRVDDDILEQIVFRTPKDLQAVLNYLTARPESDQNWASITRLVSMDRQSPWAKLWMLHSAGSMTKPDDNTDDEVCRWARRQLSERHETVRAEAAWFLALRRLLTDEDLRLMAISASDISRPALAAAAAAGGVKSKFVQSLQNESPLTKKAFAWGEATAI